MSDDFGTISARRGDRAKEIEVLRKHRESLVKMLEDVDAQLRELEVFDTPAARPLATTPDYASEYDDGAVTQPGNAGRVLLLVGVVIIALALIGWLVWRASSKGPADGAVVEETATTTTATTSEEPETTTTAPATIAEAGQSLDVTPASRDYGLVRKGTRVTRQYEIANTSDEPMSITLARSTCRCLYYEHAPVIPPKAKESITVTVDGAKAKVGTLRESIRVTSRSDPSDGTSFDVIATVQ
ncbi:MAG TPA: DUF1573 domain-containing protein [Thermoanaerobaculia bacterium]|nr:DUF1573 domain-containing protein [Thermoanaerobaculia bacterium]